MKYTIQFDFPSGWTWDSDSFIDESGAEVSHLEAHLRDPKTDVDNSMVDIYVGDMPDDITAEDQAYSNYADIVGFDEDDPEDFDPIAQIKFNGKTAYCFDALCEDDTPMMLICQEVKKGVLAIICVTGLNDDVLDSTLALVEQKFRVKKEED